MPELGITALWLLPEILEEVILTFKANKSPLEKWAGTLFGYAVHVHLSR